MAGNNKKSGSKRCEQAKAKAVNVPCEQAKAKAANGPSSTREDDKVSNLNDLNRILVKEITVLREEKTVLSTNLTAMGLEIESTRKMTEEWKEVGKELRKELEKKDAEYQSAISQIYRQLQDAEERLNTEISVKEEECRAVNLDKQNLEATVLQLKDKIQEISAELETTAKDANCEKEVLLSQILATEKGTAQITSSRQIAEDAWNLEKDKMLNRFADFQTNLELMFSEKRSLRETNRELRAETESLKAQLISEIENARKANEECGKAKKELRELEKDGDYQVAISQARKQLQEAEERFNTEISAKEEECKEVNLDKKNLEATVLQLKNQIQARSSELEATNQGRKLEKEVLLSQIVAAKKETAEITRINQMGQETWNAEKEKILGRLAELETNLEFMASEKGSLNETNRELKTEVESLKAHFVSEIESARIKTDEWKEAEKELREELGKKDDEYRAAISQAVKELQEAEERFNAETSMKEDECRRLNLDKKNLEAAVLKLKNKIQVISSELETANEDRKFEQEVFLSLEVARKETAEINRSYQMAQEDWNAEKEILLSRVAELQAKLHLVASEKWSLSETNRELKTEAESLRAQIVSGIGYARKMTEEWKEAEKNLRKQLGKKDEESSAISRALKHLQEAKERLHTETSMKEEECRALNLDKKNLEATVLKLKNQIQAITSEIKTTNEERRLENEVFLSLQVARKDTAEISRSYQMAQEDWNAEKEILLSRLSELQTKLPSVACEKGSLSETNRELKTEVDCLKARLDEYTDKLVSMEDERQVLKAVSISNADRLEDLLQQNAAMEKEINSNQVMEELSKKIVELQETHGKAVQELETLLAEAVRKCEVMEEKHSELSREKEEQGNTINSLRGEINSLMSEKSLLSKNLKEATEKIENFAERCSQVQHSTIAEEERSALVDIANCKDVHEKAKPSDVNGKQNPRNVDEKPKANDMNGTKGVQENKKPNGTKGVQENRKPINGCNQTRGPNRSQRKRK